MTEAQQTQYDRFVRAGYSAGDAALMIERGAWLQDAVEMPEQIVADIRRYRAERDARADESTPRQVGPE